MSHLVADYINRSDARPWNVLRDFQWEDIRAEKLTKSQRSAVSFITFIEDHLPGYFAIYQNSFPVHHEVDLEEFIHNREVYHFAVRWAQEEDAHAHVLQTYQVRAGLASEDDLRRDLAIEGRKLFSLDYVHPVQHFTYTLVQEKATQIYYQKFSQVVDEPVLKNILQCLIRDESRHFAFFSTVVEAYIKRFGAAIIPQLKEVLVNFKMPLAQTLKNYWRWSLRVAEVANSYDHTEAFESLIRVVKRAADAPTWSKSQDLADFVGAVRAA